MDKQSTVGQTKSRPDKPRRRKPRRSVPIAPNRGLRLPLHHQIYLVVREQILSNRYRRGEALPGEDELAKSYGVSRITIRAALKALDDDGLIDRRQGIGTFVRERIPDVPMHVAMRDQRAHMEELARYTKIKLIELDYGPAPPDVQRWFGAGPDDVFLRVVRVRAAARPVLLLTTYTPERLGRGFKTEDFKHEAHYELLKRAGVRFETGEQIITATLAGPVSAAHLQVDIGSPLIRIIYFDFDQTGAPVRHLEVLAPPSEFEIHMLADRSDERR